MKLSKYRIVSDIYLGFEVQKWRIWWPFWIQCRGNCGMGNTYPSIEKAKEFIDTHKSRGEVWREQ